MIKSVRVSPPATSVFPSGEMATVRPPSGTPAVAGEGAKVATRVAVRRRESEVRVFFMLFWGEALSG